MTVYGKIWGIWLKDFTIIYSLPSENPNKFDHFPPWKRNRKMEFPWISITSISNLNSPRTCQPLVGWAGSWMSWRVSHGESLQLRKGTSACVPFPNVCREGARDPGCKARSGWSLGGWKDLGGAILNLSFFSWILWLPPGDSWMFGWLGEDFMWYHLISGQYLSASQICHDVPWVDMVGY